MKPPSPREHPNAFAGLSVGSVTSLLVYEAKTRLGVDLTVEEAGIIVSTIIGAYLFFGPHKVT